MARRWWVVAAFGVAALVAWGALVEPRLIEVRDLQLNAGRSPAQTIAVVSDLHLDDIGARERTLLELLSARRPDVVVLLGDVVDAPGDLPALERFLSALPPSERIAVLGNWEYWSGIDLAALRSVYTRYDVRLLINDCRDGIVGLDDHTAGHPDLEAALAHCHAAGSGVAPYLLLQHSPGFFETRSGKAHAFPLSLSGHTHGGQVTLFGRALWTPPGSGSFTAGEYRTRFGRLYVTRGIGTSILPLRVGARPEVVFVRRTIARAAPPP
jgi:predicted MPP superfamily phosphohydrolase